MLLPFTSVVSYHTNPMTCGVAKFGAQLAQRLDIPFIGIAGSWGAHPLFSLKWSEPSPMQQTHLVREILEHGNCSVFWHDAGDQRITKAARHVFYAVEAQDRRRAEEQANPEGRGLNR